MEKKINNNSLRTVATFTEIISVWSSIVECTRRTFPLHNVNSLGAAGSDFSNICVGSVGFA